jgi:phospholipid/cholesterol/gamma-HCH transport system permease protein
VDPLELQIDVQRDGQAVTCRVAGALAQQRGSKLYLAAAPHLRRGRTVSLDLSGVTQADAVGASALAALLDLAEGGRGDLRITRLSPVLAAQLEHVPAEPTPSRVEHEGLLNRIGGGTERLWKSLVAMLVFMADAFFGCLVGLFSARNKRRGSLWRDALSIGVDALPVVATIGLILGLILAFQGGHLLRDFGTSIYVADLVGRGMVREFAPLMTAIVVAGRSGAAIAAEIGAMKNNEELDALTVTGIEPVRYLVVPKLYAVTVTLPMLSVMCSIVSILGGFIIAVTYLQLGPTQYINQTLQAVSINDLANCVLKSVVFGWLIVIIGAFMGFRVGRGAVGVGQAATKAVVVAIFAIIFADGIITTLDTLLR